MAIKVKDLTKSAAKWADNAGRATTAYAEGAAESGDAWARNTAAAKETFKLAISAANIAERFARGVQKAGAAKYTRKVDTVGKDRFASGVNAAVDDYKTNVEPFLTAIAGVTLPARKPRGDPGNYARVEAIGKVLNAKRLAQLSGGA